MLTITIGWWILPALITLFCLAILVTQGGGGSGDFGDGLGCAFMLIPILFVWCVYFAARTFWG
jgi:hypothetical protein